MTSDFFPRVERRRAWAMVHDGGMQVGSDEGVRNKQFFPITCMSCSEFGARIALPLS